MPNQNPEQIARDKIDAEMVQWGWVIQKPITAYALKLE